MDASDPELQAIRAQMREGYAVDTTRGDIEKECLTELYPLWIVWTVGMIRRNIDVEGIPATIADCAVSLSAHMVNDLLNNAVNEKTKAAPDIFVDKILARIRKEVLDMRDGTAATRSVASIPLGAQ